MASRSTPPPSVAAVPLVPAATAVNKSTVPDRRLPPWYPGTAELVSHAKMTGMAPAPRANAKSLVSPVVRERRSDTRVTPLATATAVTVTSWAVSGVGDTYDDDLPSVTVAVPPVTSTVHVSLPTMPAVPHPMPSHPVVARNAKVRVIAVSAAAGGVHSIVTTEFTCSVLPVLDAAPLPPLPLLLLLVPPPLLPPPPLPAAGDGDADAPGAGAVLPLASSATAATTVWVESTEDGVAAPQSVLRAMMVPRRVVRICVMVASSR